MDMRIRRPSVMHVIHRTITRRPIQTIIRLDCQQIALPAIPPHLTGTRHCFRFTTITIHYWERMQRLKTNAQPVTMVIITILPTPVLVVIRMTITRPMILITRLRSFQPPAAIVTPKMHGSLQPGTMTTYTSRSIADHITESGINAANEKKNKIITQFLRVSPVTNKMKQMMIMMR